MQDCPRSRGTAPRRRFVPSARLRLVGSMLTLVLGFTLGPDLFGADLGPTKEPQIKAAFVFNFAKFVEWPAARFSTTNSAVIIGVLSDSAVAKALEEVIRGRTINGRSLAIRVVNSADEATNVHVLVCTAADDPSVSQILPVLAQRGVLTVGDSEPFARNGGMIQFLTEGDKVRFAVNVESAEKGGLRISAQLLKLAKSVRRKA